MRCNTGHFQYNERGKTHRLHQAFQCGILQHEGIKDLLCLLAHVQQDCVVKQKEAEGVKACTHTTGKVFVCVRPHSSTAGLANIRGFVALWLYRSQCQSREAQARAHVCLIH